MAPQCERCGCRMLWYRNGTGPDYAAAPGPVRPTSHQSRLGPDAQTRAYPSLSIPASSPPPPASDTTWPEARAAPASSRKASAVPIRRIPLSTPSAGVEGAGTRSRVAGLSSGVAAQCCQGGRLRRSPGSGNPRRHRPFARITDHRRPRQGRLVLLQAPAPPSATPWRGDHRWPRSLPAPASPRRRTRPDRIEISPVADAVSTAHCRSRHRQPVVSGIVTSTRSAPRHRETTTAPPRGAPRSGAASRAPSSPAPPRPRRPDDARSPPRAR